MDLGEVHVGAAVAHLGGGLEVRHGGGHVDGRAQTVAQHDAEAVVRFEVARGLAAREPHPGACKVLLDPLAAQIHLADHARRRAGMREQAVVRLELHILTLVAWLGRVARGPASAHLARLARPHLLGHAQEPLERAAVVATHGARRIARRVDAAVVVHLRDGEHALDVAVLGEVHVVLEQVFQRRRVACRPWLAVQRRLHRRLHGGISSRGDRRSWSVRAAVQVRDANLGVGESESARRTLLKTFVRVERAAFSYRSSAVQHDGATPMPAL